MTEATRDRRLTIDLQCAVDDEGLPGRRELRRWVSAALGPHEHPVELGVRIVGSEESRALNHRYRNVDAPTNVLSFPAALPAGVPLQWLGDLVLCAPVAAEQARAQHKPLDAHWAHLVVHGTLHLLGYDHETDADAAVMEALEAQILGRLGYPDPYAAAACEELAEQ